MLQATQRTFLLIEAGLMFTGALLLMAITELGSALGSGMRRTR